MAISGISDRWLWVGFGVFFFLAAQGIRYAISDTVRLIELPPDESRAKKDEEHPEDALSLDSLRILASSPNPSIRSAAASLIITRFASQPNAAEMITTDLRSKDPETQRQARQAVKYLQDWDEELSTDLPHTLNDSSPLPWQGSLEDDFQNAMSPLQQLENLTNPYSEEREGVASFAGWDRIPVERPVTVGQEEAERRRRRREATVFHEGPGRINEDDIIRPR